MPASPYGLPVAVWLAPLGCALLHLKIFLTANGREFTRMEEIFEQEETEA